MTKISELTEETSPAAADWVETEVAAGGTGKKVSLSSLGTAQWRFTVMPEIQSAGGGVVVGKALGSGSTSPFELQHADTEAYLFHLTGGPTMDTTAALIGMGVDYGGRGLFVANKLTGIGIQISQNATITSASAFGFQADQFSNTAPLIQLAAQAADAETLLRITSSLALNDGVLLTQWRDNTDVFGWVDGGTGGLTWQKDVVVSSTAAGQKAKVKVTDEAAKATQLYMSADFTAGAAVQYYKWAGSGDLWYGFQTVATSDRWKLNASEGSADIGVETYNTMIEVRSNAGAGSLGQMGFFGTTPANKPTGVAVTAAGVHAALVTLGLIAA